MVKILCAGCAVIALASAVSIINASPKNDWDAFPAVQQKAPSKHRITVGSAAVVLTYSAKCGTDGVNWDLMQAAADVVAAQVNSGSQELRIALKNVEYEVLTKMRRSNEPTTDYPAWARFCASMKPTMVAK